MGGGAEGGQCAREGQRGHQGVPAAEGRGRGAKSQLEQLLQVSSQIQTQKTLSSVAIITVKRIKNK